MHLGPEQGTGTGIHPRPDQSSPPNECPATGARGTAGMGRMGITSSSRNHLFPKNTDDSSADVYCWVWPLSVYGKQLSRFRKFSFFAEDACGATTNLAKDFLRLTHG